MKDGRLYAGLTLNEGYPTQRVMGRQGSVRGGPNPRARWGGGPWAGFALAGSGLAVAGLVGVRLSTGVPPGNKLEAPRTIDGEVAPSRVIE